MKTAEEYALDYANDATDMYSHEVLTKHFLIAMKETEKSMRHRAAEKMIRMKVGDLPGVASAIWDDAMQEAHDAIMELPSEMTAENIQGME